MESLVASTLASYRRILAEDTVKGSRRLFVVPYCLVGTFVIPALWLSIPHARRPWLYRSRWLVVIVVLLLNLDQALQASSYNVAASYGTGLVATWGSMLCLNFLVWTRPQRDAARAIKVPPKSIRPQIGHVPDISAANKVPSKRGAALLRKRVASPDLQRPRSPPPTAGHTRQPSADQDAGFVWQCFPEEASFTERLGWAVDLLCSFRGSGWNWSSSAIPRPADVKQTKNDEPVDVESIPQVSRDGYQIPLTEKDFLSRRFKIILISYLILDFLSTFMVKDPYFVVGPDVDLSQYPLPSYLQNLTPPFLKIYRLGFSFMGTLSAIAAIFSSSEVVQYFVIQHFCPCRDGLWFYASTYGSFDQVFQRGLGGFWGSWWHQSFRIQFIAPATFLLRKGYMKKGTTVASIVAVFVTFLQSGLLHMSGSLTSMPQTEIWRPMMFFLLQALGVLIEPLMPWNTMRSPTLLRRGANLTFVLVWMYMTAPFFTDDLASSGLWMLEPVPISPLRFLGFGYPNDHWWRWDIHYVPRWHTANKWWHSGFTL